MSNDRASSMNQDPTRPARKSGRAAFADDGRCVWEWQTDTGVFSRDVTDAQLSKLEAPQLELVDPDAITLRRSQRPLARAPLQTVAKPTISASGGRLRRLLRRVARIIA